MSTQTYTYTHTHTPYPDTDEGTKQHHKMFPQILLFEAFQSNLDFIKNIHSHLFAKYEYTHSRLSPIHHHHKHIQKC